MQGGQQFADIQLVAQRPVGRDDVAPIENKSLRPGALKNFADSTGGSGPRCTVRRTTKAALVLAHPALGVGKSVGGTSVEGGQGGGHDELRAGVFGLSIR